MNGIILGVLIPVAAAAIPAIIGFALPRKKTYAWGLAIGKFCSTFLRQKLGTAGGQTVENRFQTTIADFIEGLNAGLDQDDTK